MKLLPFLALIPVVLVGCSAPKKVAVEPAEPTFPVYCIRDVEFIGSDRVLVDMPGLYHGQDDAPIEVSKETYYTLGLPDCAANDPRMNGNV